MRHVQIAFFDGGGGHRNAASALKEVLEQKEQGWSVRLLNLQELFDPIDVVRRVSGVRMQDVYNSLLKRGWTLGAAELLRVTHFIIRRLHASGVRLLEDHWRATQPDLVVSVVPNLNRALCESVRRVLPSSPFVTILTDLADYPPHFWIEPEPQFFICGTPYAVEQAKALKHPADHVFLASGMILNPRFYEPAAAGSRPVERTRLGLSPETTTGIVLFGGEGPKVIMRIARSLEASGLPLQLILICGRNAALADALRRMKWRIPVHVEGFTRDVPRFMGLADFLIGKPGPGSLSEAFVMGLPVIVDLNAWTLPQERFNAEWVRRAGLGVVIKHFNQVNEAVAQLLDPPTLRACRANVAALRIRAVFEIPGVLETIITRHADQLVRRGAGPARIL